MQLCLNSLKKYLAFKLLFNSKTFKLNYFLIDLPYRFILKISNSLALILWIILWFGVSTMNFREDIVQKVCAIQYIVHFFTFWCTGATNDSIELNVPLHPGTKVMYTWRFGTGDVMHSTDRVANYTWTEAGVYTIKLTAENKVSNVQVTVSFIIVVKSNVKNYTWIERGWSSEQI